MTQTYLNQLTYSIIGCAIEVHKHLGPGLLESVYEQCLCKELYLQGFKYEKQMLLPIEYKGIILDNALRIDIMVEDLILVELKCVENFLTVHEAQLLSYMKLLKRAKGILINFNCTNIFKEGQKTLVNHLFAELPF